MSERGKGTNDLIDLAFCWLLLICLSVLLLAWKIPLPSIERMANGISGGASETAFLWVCKWELLLFERERERAWKKVRGRGRDREG